MGGVDRAGGGASATIVVAMYEFWLKAGIALLGVRFVVGDVLKMGGVSLACVVIELAISIVLMTDLGRLFGLSDKLTRWRRFWRWAPSASSRSH